MTTHTEEPVREDLVPSDTPTLIPNAIYERASELYLATDPNHMVGLLDPEETPVLTQVGDTLHLRPGCEDWVHKMVAVRRNDHALQLNASRYTAHLFTEVKNMRDYIQRLGEALLEKAVDKDWCSEYDDFADEWDLPKRTREFEVTMTVTVIAANDEEACTVVSNQCDLSVYHDFVVNGATYEASEL